MGYLPAVNEQSSDSSTAVFSSFGGHQQYVFGSEKVRKTSENNSTRLVMQGCELLG